ncbi:hypothetical protein SAMN04487917_11383 [Arthrobacter sp. yr096]|uniref:hypothetical protein n=1 Tax=Arthrobacter sp. yr096 TaxID=1761750 RepID=UPI0008D1A4BA|nr:hypothetical protein [Arthrobacter sp. yr096]SEJ78470.1 hypothetical protein SAMN04487917_11383 [Arthrobacter sp. yr096]
MDQFIQFLIQGEAPWWSALVGTVVGGLITHLTTRQNAREQRVADRIKHDDERVLIDREKWRAETIGHVSDMLVANYRLRNHVLTSRRAILAKYPESPKVADDERAAFISELEDYTETVLPLQEDLQRRWAILQIIADGDLAEAAGNLFLKLADHHPELSKEDFHHSVDKASKAAAILMRIAQRELGFPFASRTGLVTQLGG